MENYFRRAEAVNRRVPLVTAFGQLVAIELRILLN